MKKALLALVAAAVLFFGYRQIRSHGTHAGPPGVAPLPPAPAGNPPLVVAVQSSLRDAASRARIEDLLKNGADPNSVDRNGRPALTLAVRNGDAGAAEALLAKGADPNKRDADMQWTPLMHAAFVAARDPQYLKALELLLAKGADPNAQKDGTTALHVAVNNIDAMARDARVIDDLLKAGANPEGVTPSGSTSFATPPMVLAAWNGKTAAAVALARGGANAENGVRTALNHQHPELAAALKPFVKLAPKPAPAEPGKKKRRR